MNENNAQQVITFRDIWELFLQRLVIILLVSALAVAGFYVYNKVTFVPMYQSTATLYITGDGEYEDSTSADAYNNYSLTLKVVDDCEFLLSSRSVLETLIDNMGLDINYSVLQNRITIENPSNTRVLEVTVEAEKPQLAKDIVDQLCKLGTTKINSVMTQDESSDDYVSVYEEGTKSDYPSNITPKLTYLLVGLVAGALTFGLCLLIFLLDDRIQSADHIEQILGLSVLGDIPDCNSTHSRGRYGYRYGYYRGKSYGPYGRAYGPYSKPYGAYGHSHNSKKKGKG